MTRANADAVLDRMENDESFAVRVRDAGGQNESLTMLRSEGFEVTSEELRDAFMDRYGDNLSQEQLEAVAGGIDHQQMNAMFVAGAPIVLGAAAGAIFI